VTFKERVHEAIMKGAVDYKSVFIDFEYLIYCNSLKNKPYYIISADEDNYPHLTGVSTLLTAQEFYNACINGTLQETDFDFASKNRSEKEVIGSVRRKIQMLPLITSFFINSLQAEEDFSKGSVHCSLAAADNTLTIGFVDVDVLRPKTLLKRNELNPKNAIDITLVLRRKKGNENFDTIMQGDVDDFNTLFPRIYCVM
jgi:hypothetical protein